MADNMPSAAEAMYGPDGPISDGPNFNEPSVNRARAMIESGIARPASEQGRPAPLFGERPGGPAQPSPTTPAGADTPYDPARMTLPDGYEAGEMMGEFNDFAREAGFSQKRADRAMDIHRRSVEARLEAHDAQRKAQHEQARADWLATSERDYGAALPRMIDDINRAIGNDALARRFGEVLQWYGLEHEPAVLGVMHRLATGGRRY
jgi:hypothetical protein